MSFVQFDRQKIEQLLNSATSERQRKMYQALLDKARSQKRSSTDSSASGTTPETEKKAKTKTKGQTETKTKTETKTTNKKKKKATPQSARTTHGTEPSSVPVSSTTFASPAIQSTKPVTESTQLIEEESSVPPQTSPKSLSKEPPKQQSDAEPPIFQALGALIATPYVKGDRLKVVIDKREYDLLCIRGRGRKAYISLLEELEKNGSKPMFLRVYPQATFDQSSAEPILSFSLVNYSQDGEKINDSPFGFPYALQFVVLSKYLLSDFRQGKSAPCGEG